MKTKKKVLIFLLIILAAIQFMQPTRNISSVKPEADISQVYHVPANVYRILKTSCYDCHSNNTYYPWYSYIQPAGWLLYYDVKKGKEALNFNVFGSYSTRRQKSKLRSIQGTIRDDKMPLPIYTLMHPDSKLTDSEKQVIFDWLKSISVTKKK